jgi:2-oxoglutarate ferredoxin oxidoreductase subunit beta
VNPITLAIIGGATFVSRGFVGKLDHLKNLVARAIKHKGFSLVDILQPCVTFNYKNTYQWYNQRVYIFENEGYGPDDKIKALEKGEEWGDKIPLGVFYRVQKPTYEDNLPQIKDVPLVFQKIEDVDIRKAMEEFV